MEPNLCLHRGNEVNAQIISNYFQNFGDTQLKARLDTESTTATVSTVFDAMHSNQCVCSGMHLVVTIWFLCIGTNCDTESKSPCILSNNVDAVVVVDALRQRTVKYWNLKPARSKLLQGR